MSNLLSGEIALISSRHRSGEADVAVDLPGAKVFEDFFPDDILRALVDDVESSSVRKREFRLWLTDERVPRPLLEAVEFSSEKTGLQFNFCILKWYRISDEYDSLAYIVHRDPEELRSIPLVLGTLKGQADLVYWDSSRSERTIRCKPNMMVLLDADLEHQVTPPIGPEGERFLLFLGFDTRFGTAISAR